MQIPIQELVPTFTKKDLLSIPADAVNIHSKIVSHLEQLERAECPSCLDQEFKLLYFRTMELFEEYQKIVIKNSPYSVSCKRGCSHCCSHWVEDVNSFEAEIIAEYIQKCFPERIDSIIEQCKKDIQVIESIEKITIDKLKETDSAENIDHIDLALSVFYQMQIPCPLLSDNGTCSVYKVRPLTCRIYMSFSDSKLCKPQYQDQEDITNYLLNLEESASEILDRMHFRYQKYVNDTGLRSLVMKYLQK